MNPANSQQALAQLQQTQKKAQNPQAILAQQQQQLGVNAAQDTVTGLRGAINNTTKLLERVAPSVMGRTANSLVTDAQANRQIQNEQAPISATLTKQGTDYGQANEDLGRLSDRASQAAQLAYQGQQDKQSYLQNLYNTLYSREQAAQEARRAELDRREQIRQFNAQLAASQKVASGGGITLGGDLGGLMGSSSTPSTKPVSKAPTAIKLSGNRTPEDALRDVQNLIKTASAKAYIDNITGIMKSAKRGNTYDQAKLQILQAKSKGWFKKGKLNTAYIKNLAKHGLLKA